ncbi:MAG: hypothetical protein AB8E15_07250 [Bdellovibrionales bacterium]
MLKSFCKKLVPVVGLLVFSSLAKAQEGSNTADLEKKKDFNLSTSVSVTAGDSVNTENEPNTSISYNLNLVGRFENGYTITLDTYLDQQANKENSNNNSSEVRDLWMQVGKCFADVKAVDCLGYDIVGTIGNSTGSQKSEKVGSLGAKLKYSKKFSNFNISQYVRYTRNFYNAEITKDGRVNNSDIFRLLNVLQIPFGDKLRFSGAIVYDYALSFQNVGKAFFHSDFSLGYNISKMYNFTLGVETLSQSTKAADGVTDQVKLLSARGSTGYVRLGASF